MPLRDHRGNAAPATLAVPASGSDLTLNCSPLTNWPLGGPNGPFFVTLGRGTSNEERLVASSRSGDILNIAVIGDRGLEDTAAVLHPAGTTVEHTFSATEAEEANDHIFDVTRDDHTQYYNPARHDIPAAHTFGGAYGTPAVPAPLVAGAAGTTGVAVGPPRSDHTHAVPTAVASTILGVNVEGSQPTFARSDHNHALANIIQRRFVPPGGIIMYGGTIAPEGFILAQGQAISRVTFADLFAIFSTAYGNGDGSTTFNVPDMRQRFPLGLAASGTGSTLGASGGTINHVHGHNGADAAADIGLTTSGNNLRHRRANIPNYSPTHEVSTSLSVVAGSGSFGLGTTLSGDTQTANPPFMTVNYLIKT